MKTTLRKILGALGAALIICLAAMAPASAAEVTVLVDGQAMYFDQPPVMSGGRILVPLRGIFERLGADVVYNAASRSINATRGSTVIQLHLGSTSAMVDGRTVFLDTPAQTFGGRTVVPLRFISEALGASVTWSAATKTVQIASSTTPSGGTPPPVVAGRPTIDNIVHNGTTGLRAGDVLTVLVTGTAGSAASFDLLGISNGNALRETAAGRYEGSFTVSNQMVSSGRNAQAALVIHFTKNGLEAIQQAATAVVLAGTGNTANRRRGATLIPAANSTSPVMRPLIMARFTSTASPGSLRLILDGQDVTGGSTSGPSDIFFVPRNDLAPGQHNVQLSGTDSNGTSLNQSWMFTVPQGALPGPTINSVSTNANAYLQAGQAVTVTMTGINGGIATMDFAGRTGLPMQEVQPGTYVGTHTINAGDNLNGRFMVNLRLPNGMMVNQPSLTWFSQDGAYGNTPAPNTGAIYVTVTSPQSGQRVAKDFTVGGRTTPFATVQVRASLRHSLIPGIIDVNGQTVTASVQADGNGNYAAPIHFDSVRSNSSLTLDVQARDTNGNTSQPVQVNVAIGD